MDKSIDIVVWCISDILMYSYIWTIGPPEEDYDFFICKPELIF